MSVFNHEDDEQNRPDSLRPVGGYALLAVVLFAGWILYSSFSADHWVPILDGANLLFHEAGHPFFGLFSERLAVYGGTLGQLVFPVVVSGYFWQRKETASMAVGLIWFGQNFLNIGRYMADARARVLPLVGNGDRLHDWEEILGRWGCLQQDVLLAGLLRGMAVLEILGVLLWLVWHYYSVSEQRDGR